MPIDARDQLTDVVLTVGSGFGGFQSAMVLAGEHWALLGANGAGKSTLLGLLAERTGTNGPPA
ncbi:hypothetical protein Saa2_03591 [Streptomyces acidiscabies]|nr:hypothetical protein Saa2_03591 [Streptomyces acidiscabies]